MTRLSILNMKLAVHELDQAMVLIGRSGASPQAFADTHRAKKALEKQIRGLQLTLKG
jgi:hypothetical protein